LKSTGLRHAIEENIRRFNREESERTLTPAAVAIVLLEDEGAFSVPIFQRPSSMPSHAGQMALPGGKLHAGETAEDCAIRELREELGLRVNSTDVLGRLDDFDTKSGFTITPVVIWSAAHFKALRPSRSEVAWLLAVDLDELRAAALTSGAGNTPAFSLKLPWVEVFAPTAAILYQFSEVALDGRTCRVADFYQPPFTHR
jgi:8-oxo-dGTP pyrophosphatase MutT (NUDIX family)